MTRIEVLSSYNPIPGFQRSTAKNTSVTKIKKKGHQISHYFSQGILTHMMFVGQEQSTDNSLVLTSELMIANRDPNFPLGKMVLSHDQPNDIRKYSSQGSTLGRVSCLY